MYIIISALDAVVIDIDCCDHLHDYWQRFLLACIVQRLVGGLEPVSNSVVAA
jgi:hypothetical protein